METDMGEGADSSPGGIHTHTHDGRLVLKKGRGQENMVGTMQPDGHTVITQMSITGRMQTETNRNRQIMSKATLYWSTRSNVGCKLQPCRSQCYKYTQIRRPYAR
eukprot:scpid110918/ scgid22702/ 